MFNNYEEFVYFIAKIAETAKKVSDETYNEWKKKCIAMEEEEGNPELLKEVLKAIDEYSGHGCQNCQQEV